MLQKETIVEITDKSKGFYSTFCSSAQTRWESKINLKSETLKQVYQGSEVQNVYSSDNNPDIMSRGLVGIYRFKRHILSCSNTRKSQTVSQVGFPEMDLSVQWPAIQNINGPKNIYKNLSFDSRNFARKGVRICPYLDDYLVVAKSWGQLLKAVQLTVDVLGQAGFLINIEKSHPCPVQTLQFLGIQLDTLQAASFLPKDCALELKQTALDFMKPGSKRSARQFLRLLGLMAAAILMIPLARLKMRPIQIYLNTHWRAAYQPLDFLLQIPHWLIEHIAWWTDLSNLTQGSMWKKIPPTRVLTTDASLEG